MKIPEYNRQVGLDLANRSGVSIKEPDIFRDTSDMQNIGKQVLGTAGDLSEVYLDMKKERDNGIVNEFMNQFSLEQVNKINELKEQYKGANSEGIVDAYMEWQDDYISKRTGFTQDLADGDLYLENEEQIKSVKDSFAKNLPSTVNSLSGYIARELEDYKKNQFTARVELLTNDAISSDDGSVQFRINELNSAVDNYYAGESPEFIALTKKKLTGNIYESRLIGESSENPSKALVVLQNKDYIANVDTKTRNEIEAKAINNWKKQIAAKMASADTLDIDAVLTEQDAKVIAPYVEKYGKDRLEWDIVKQARAYIGKQNKAQKDNENKTSFETISSITKIKDNKNLTVEEKEQKFGELLSNVSFEEAVDLSMTFNNIEMIDEYKKMQNGTWKKEESPYTEEDILSIASRERDSSLVAEAMDYIDNGEVVELKNFHPEDAKILMDRMALAEDWRALDSDWKEQTGQDLNKYIDTEFNRVTNKKSKAYPFYNFAIKNLLSEYVYAYKKQNGKYPQGKDFEKIIVHTISDINNQNPNISKLISIEDAIAEGKSGYSEELFLKQINDKFEDSLSKQDKEDLASALMNKRYNKALYLVDPVVIAQKQIKQREKDDIIQQKEKVDVDITSGITGGKSKLGEQIVDVAEKNIDIAAEVVINTAIDVKKNIESSSDIKGRLQDAEKQISERYNDSKDNKLLGKNIRSLYEIAQQKIKIAKENPTPENVREVEGVLWRMETAGDITSDIGTGENKLLKQIVGFFTGK